MTSRPEATLDRSDPGDETMNRYRYQHAYGVILLIAAMNKKLAYVALWCEHWEDFMAEKDDGKFDSYQIKTREPELGPWKVGDAGLMKSIRRFAKLDKKFAGMIDNHHFVSNLKPYASKQEKELPKCPKYLLTQVAAVKTAEELPQKLHALVTSLAQKSDVTTDELIETLRRVRLIHGPSKDDYDSVVAHQHLPQCNGCAGLPPAQLNGLRDEMIQVIYRASSVAVDDPAVHWIALNDSDSIKPGLLAKRICVVDFADQVFARRVISFRFTPADGFDGLATLAGEQKSVLEQKFTRGGLAQYQDHMKWRAMSAEEHLLALGAKDPEQANIIVDQLRGVVQGVCLDAHAQVSAGLEPWGSAMYRKVVDRLQHIDKHESASVLHQTMDCTMGVAGLLTGECSVWWSPKFKLEEQP